MSLGLQFLISVSGLWFVFRLLNPCSLFARCSRHHTKIVTAAVIAITLSACVLPDELFLPVILLFMGASLSAAPVVAKRISNRTGTIPYHHVMDEVLANMIAGQGFRTAWMQMCKSHAPPVRHYLENLLERVAFSQQTALGDGAEDRLMSELLRIDREAHRARQRIQELRERFHLQERFRRRSRHVTMQIRIQAGVLTALYCSLCAVQVCTRPWTSSMAACFAGSVPLFGFGMWCFFWISRRFRWSI